MITFLIHKDDTNKKIECTLEDSISSLKKTIMKEFNLIDSLSKVPTNTKNYIKHENVLKDFGKQVNLTMGQLDFVLWYYKTGKFIK